LPSSTALNDSPWSFDSMMLILSTRSSFSVRSIFSLSCRVTTTDLPRRSSIESMSADFLASILMPATNVVYANATCFCRSRVFVVEPHSRSILPSRSAGIRLDEDTGTQLHVEAGQPEFGLDGVGDRAGTGPPSSPAAASARRCRRTGHWFRGRRSSARRFRDAAQRVDLLGRRAPAPRACAAGAAPLAPRCPCPALRGQCQRGHRDDGDEIVVRPSSCPGPRQPCPARRGYSSSDFACSTSRRSIASAGFNAAACS